MQITRMHLKNFRSHVDSVIHFNEDLNVLIGKNDVGKSSILEALEIFFNNKSVSIDPDDCSKKASSRQITIQVSFKVDKKKNYIIDTIPTNIAKEFLLDSCDELTIKKTWDCSGKTITAKSSSTYIVADYPEIFQPPLVSLKIAELKKKLTELGLGTSTDKRKSSEIRQAIYTHHHAESSPKKEVDISIDAEDGKKIYDSLKNDFPMFFLFKADRENKDSDSEVQSPLKAITKGVIAGLEEELEALKKKIENAAIEIGQKTIEKLGELNPDIASELKPNMSSKAWDSLFSFTFDDEDGIPINKRGSGVRRLILLSYFRAEAERVRSSSRTIIYALEEPETAQHPDWQIKLYDALVDLSEIENTQIFMTTHSPSLAARIHVSKIIYLHKQNSQLLIEKDKIGIFGRICESLGMLPDIKITQTNLKLIICMEGKTDIELLKKFGKNSFDIDINAHPEILLLPLGGSNLQNFADYSYLSKLATPEMHIYDRDKPEYKKFIDKINAASPSNYARLTQFYAIENYIHPSLHVGLYSTAKIFVDTQTDTWKEGWKDLNIAKNFNAMLQEEVEGGNNKITGHSQQKIKTKLCEKLSEKMTRDLLIDLGADDEVNEWFDFIKSKLASTEGSGS